MEFTATQGFSDQHALSPKTWPGAVGTVSRMWHFKATGGNGGHKVVLRHSYVTGVFVLLVDGVYVYSGTENVTVRTFELKFKLKEEEAVPCRILFDGTDSIYFEHKLLVNEVHHSDIRNILEINMGESFPISISIPSYKTFTELGKTVVLYQVKVKKSVEESFVVERRYSHFVSLDACIVSATDTHLASSLPTLPPKCYNFWTDQTSDEFINARKFGLEVYLNNILQTSKVKFYTGINFGFPRKKQTMRTFYTSPSHLSYSSSQNSSSS